MRKTKTQEIVFGAAMLSIYALIMLLDRYSGGMLYMLFYYFLPLPFMMYGLKFGTGMYGVLMFGSVVLGFIFGLPETAFFGVTAILVSYLLVSSIQKQWTGTKTMVLVICATVLSQIASITIFSSLFGYNLAEEIEYIMTTIKDIANQFPNIALQIEESRVKVIFAFSTILLGCIEAFVFMTVADLVLLRMKIARVPKFSILQLKIPKIIGVLFIIVGYLQTKSTNDLLLFIFLALWMMILAQGLSYCFFVNGLLIRKPILNSLAFLSCFLPIFNYFITGMGLIDIFSSNRKKIMYNINQRGE